MKIKIKNKKGGGIKPNLKIGLEKKIFIPSTNKLYFKTPKTNEKKFITIHEQGVLEYNNKFFIQEQDYHLIVNDGVVSVSDKRNIDPNGPLFYKIKDLKKELKFNSSNFGRFLFYEGKSVKKYFSDDKNSEEKE